MTAWPARRHPLSPGKPVDNRNLDRADGAGNQPAFITSQKTEERSRAAIAAWLRPADCIFSRKGEKEGFMVVKFYGSAAARRLASVAMARTVDLASVRAWFFRPATRLVTGTQRFV